MQANSKQAPVVAVGNSSSETDGGSGGAGQPSEPPVAQQSPPVVIPSDSAAPVPTLDIEPEETKKTKKPTKEPIAQVPQVVTEAPRPQTTTKSAEPTPTPTKKKKTTLVEPDVEPTEKPTSGPTTTVRAEGEADKPGTSLKPNPYKVTAVCGTGYKVVDSRALGSNATVYLLYHSGAGKNCVVTMSRLVHPGKMPMSAIPPGQGRFQRQQHGQVHRVRRPGAPARRQEVRDLGRLVELLQLEVRLEPLQLAKDDEQRAATRPRGGGSFHAWASVLGMIVGRTS
ncbi:hypothetical protein GCM10020220_100670 [Nonomuraea rubra]|uniref:hypothetical protein n=1 Tax=Nonomuraea rubra TaxID=46180 RepID=UPI0031EB52D7